MRRSVTIGILVQRVSRIVHDLEQIVRFRGTGRRSIRLPDRVDELSESELVLLAHRHCLLIIRDGYINGA
jgi:hypothetical protein